MLVSHPQYEQAKKLFRGGSGLFNFHLKTDKLRDVERFTNSLKLFKRAVSWGGYESLVFPNGIKYREGDNIPQEKLSLIRLHAGLEQGEDLIEDLENALR